ncbi:MAG: type II toxin-antitoxin system death-on-curing family toxin [Gammaproteobacteria bacterium]|nr:type II toxin-antitoxin system death-on-curing family toxin [Gammaproteobacteria bacterium]MYL01610.1 type II toxin-antitoxin system death-on-curing family toxin [Gammaproteobacteria bacterium]
MSGADSASWRWVEAGVVHAIHDRQLAEHGGKDGVRDAGAIESALARPINKAAYQDVDAAGLAAAYTYGLSRNHGFSDGNKRTAWVTARVFLADNGAKISFDRLDAIQTMEGVAAGEISEKELAEWFRSRLVS